MYDAEGHKNGETKGREKVRMGKALCVPTGSQCAWQSKSCRLRTLLIIALVLLKSETCRKTGIYFTYDACGINRPFQTMKMTEISLYIIYLLRAWPIISARTRTVRKSCLSPEILRDELKTTGIYRTIFEPAVLSLIGRRVRVGISMTTEGKLPMRHTESLTHTTSLW